ncbi:MAG: UDP-4-amino-4,6-dideoxy-N-acetyl-beta-L-altrosamine transaminase [Bacteroidia bacterium]|nr:UDP-4-amino-4,6-dideoxy-N-acetyl-beta-L-altrosamine transaminase [Bacteroidia bacterium]
MAIPYGRQSITEEDIIAVAETLRSDYLTGGPRIAQFEEAFARYIGVKYAVAVANGTAALHLCAMSLGVKPGQKVITTPNTFAATANCVLYCGGEIEFADIDPQTLLLDPNRVEEKLRHSPPGAYRGIIPVDFAGMPVNLEDFRTLADKYGCWLLEDACHAPGGYFTDRLGSPQFCGNGKFAELAIFSFHPVKHIACGEGGMITTNDEAHYQRLLRLRTHGITRERDQMTEDHGGWYYEMLELGYNYRLSDIHAALGWSQLQRADAGLARRRALASRYDEAFAGTAVETPMPHAGHAYHLYVVQTPHRKALYEHLRSKGIYAQIHYIPVHYQPYYQQLGWKKGDFPHTEAYYERCLSLPLYPTLTDDEQDFVVQCVRDFD